MQETSRLYQDIYLSRKYRFETSLVIGEAGRLLTDKGEVLRFGGDAILVSSGSAEGGYGEDRLISVKTTHRTFSNNVPEVGCCPCGEIYVEMLMPLGQIEQMAMIAPFVRLVSTVDGRASEWLRKGVYYIDTRDNTKNRDDLDILRIHGYDAMLKADVPYVPSQMDFPAKDIDIIYDIAGKIGVSVDARCLPLINREYTIQYPTDYTMREVLGYIGAMYAGNWIINDNGELQLLCLYDLPPETSLLIDELGYRITFGEDRILL